MKLKLYHYWRSSSAWRVRWALAHKGIECEMQAVNLLNGENESAEHLARNPLGFVPVLEFLGETNPKKRYLSESVAIIEWLDENFPNAPLYPKDSYLRARTRALIEVINAGTQPLQNIPAQTYYAPTDSPEDTEKKKKWTQHWIQNGLAAYDKLCAETCGTFSMGNELTAADIFLVPQCYNALRWEVPLAQFPNVERIYKNALDTEAYKTSEPDRYKPN